ncbi:hypothetical protein [Streptomyces sp. S.PB5]|uniref:hypothetical protein n=1 Tax=Streptomyces sp. S.PB5 TaxID=3020844 RepID=UPI0025B2770F|nr:hypothetical protein [Streptomyces sp. S.PB5]MDN3027066.1 hypothetical protein [Streptomyces sp. S.PB5]
MTVPLLVRAAGVGWEGCRVPASVLRAAATPADVMRARAESATSLPAPLVALWSVRDGLLTESGGAVYSAGASANATPLTKSRSTRQVSCSSAMTVVAGGFLLRADDPDSAVFSSGLGDLDPADFEVVSADFASWIESLRPAPSC